MADIRAEVANALHWTLAVPRYSVTAEVNDGLVTLHGVVERALQQSARRRSYGGGGRGRRQTRGTTRTNKRRRTAEWADLEIMQGRAVSGCRMHLERRKQCPE